MSKREGERHRERNGVSERESWGERERDKGREIAALIAVPRVNAGLTVSLGE